MWCVHDGSLVGISKEFIMVPTCDHHRSIWDVNLYHLNELFVLRLTEKEVGYRFSSLRYSKKHRAIIHWKNSVHHFLRLCVLVETGRHWFESPSLQVCSFAELVMDAPQAGLDITRCNEQMTCAGLGFCRAWWCKEGPCSVSGNSCLQGSVGTKAWTASQPLLHHVLHHLPTSFHYLIAKNAFCIFA